MPTSAPLATLWKEAQKAPESIDDLVAQINDPGFEFTSRPQRIGHFTAFLNRIGTMKARSATGRSCSGRRPITSRAIDNRRPCRGAAGDRRVN